MLQFTTTNVINSAKDSNTAIDKYAGANGVFNVARVGSFKKDNVVSIYKTAYNASTPEVAKVRIPTADTTKVYRLTVDVRLINATNSEYASAYLYFKKPVVVEVLGKASAALTAAALVKEINGLKDRYGVSYVKAEVINTDYVQVTCTESHQRIKSMIVEEETASTSTLILPEYKDVSAGTFSVTTAGVQGFGDDEWMQRAIVLPTAENVRYYGINKDGRPIIGGNYSQYTLRYSIVKDGNDGIVSGGTSVTTHVFYVLESLIPSFEAAIIAAGLSIIAMSASQAFTLTAVDDASAAVSIDITDLVPFILSSAEITATSSVVGKATIGAITVDAPTGTPATQTAHIVLTKVATGATTISVTIDGVTKTKAVTIG